MKVNANYSWIKCLECNKITKILPGQTFRTAEDFTKLSECDCVEEKPKRTRKKVEKDAT
jgi:hypothetical protein